MTWTRRVSIVLTLGLVAVLALWDLVPAFTPQSGDTVSEFVRDLVVKWPAVAYGLGVLAGHFIFHSKLGPAPTWSMLTAIGSIPLTLSLDWLAQTSPWGVPPWGLFILGIFIGHTLWPQNPEPHKALELPAIDSAGRK